MKKVVRYWQFASTLVEAGGEAHRIHVCQAVPQRADGAARQAEVEFLTMQISRGKRRHIVVECGKYFGK